MIAQSGMTARVVAISGWRGSGKDTIAEHLEREHGYTRISFARVLKDRVAEQYQIPREYLDSPTKKEMPLTQYPAIPTDAFTESVHELLRAELSSGYWTPRALCILEGSAKRAVNSNFWVQKVMREVLYNTDKKYVISDLRYKSEADTLRLLLPDLLLLRVQRFESINTEDPSERDLDDYKFDCKIYNRGTVEELHDALDVTFRIVGSSTSY